MAPTTAREVARRILAVIDTKERFASDALDTEMSAAGLEERERRLCTELVYGVLRHRRRLDAALVAATKQGKLKVSRQLRTVLRLGSYQILMLERVPAHAAVDDAVSAARAVGGQRLAGLTNAVLRRLAREGERTIASYEPAVRYSMPDWVAAELSALREPPRQALSAFNEPAPLAARLSPRFSVESTVQALRDEGDRVRVESASVVPRAVLIRGLGDPSRSTSWAQGRWTVQDIGAQLVSHLVDPQPGELILDACAGVGGKTTHLAELAPDCRIHAVDRSQLRLRKGQQAAQRLALSNITAMTGDVLEDPDGLSAAYDSVLLDAPCSGLGVMRRHPEVKWRVEEDDAAGCARTQLAMLDKLAARVRAGGRLVYAVCSFVRAEGWGVVEAFLERHPEFSLAPPVGATGIDWCSVTEDPGVVRTWPDLHNADGFFAVKLTKRC